MTLRQKTLIVTIAGITAIVLSGIAQFWSMNRINHAWDSYITDAEIREELLTDIKQQFGYGGIIHNFKNFVLRGQPKFIDSITANRETMLKDIKRYKTFPLSQEEVRALDVIESVLGLYSSNTALVKNMRANGATPSEIDSAVKINDAPAFKAFTTLTKHVTAISEADHHDIRMASRLQFIFLVISFISLTAVIILAVFIQRSQTSMIVSLSRTMTDIESNKNFSKRIHDNRSDEVGQLTATFDKLLANIESMLALNRAVLDAVPDPIFLGKEGKVVFGNTVAASYAGVHIKDFQGMDAADVLIRAEHAEDRGDYITCIKDGEEVILDEVITEVTDKSGRSLGSLVVARDVTMIVRREAESEANLTMIREVGVEINNAAQELVTSTEALSARIEAISEGAHTQQKISGEAAAAMSRMNETVLQVAQNASGAAEQAEQARGKAVEGAEIVEQSIGSISSVSQQTGELKQSMDELGNHTESIGAIIGVINDIADQTNLLALNAAIEAARAGEAGRGFAVVADEVRKLAEKTMDATKNVAAAIESIQQVARQNIEGMDSAAMAVAHATELAGKSGEALKAIVQLVEGTTRQVQTIATASEEQSESSEKVMSSVSEVSVISDQTADGMRESTNAIRGLTDLAQRLEELAAKAG